MDNKFRYYGVAYEAKIILEEIAFLFSYGEFYHWSPSFLTFAALINSIEHCKARAILKYLGTEYLGSVHRLEKL